ncbi:MAG: hypothetical protein ACFFE2_00525 [Candidatus Thorarchaeota archaeon]
MKRNHATKLIVVMSFLVLVIAAANSVVANSDYTSECGNCHTNTGTLTVTTNSTVDAETGDSFTLQIEAGNGAEYIAIKSGWADNDYFMVSEPLVQDGSTNDTNGAAGEISVAITFTPFTNGTYTIRIWTAAAGALSDSFDVAVNVTGEPGTLPTTPPPLDRVEIWRMMMIGVPIVTGVLLIIFGYLAFRRGQ